MTSIDLTSLVEDYETVETGAHKHALDIACIWSKLRTVVEQPLLITSRHAISPRHRSAQPPRRLNARLKLQVMALLRKMQTAPSPLAKRAEDRAAPFPHVNQLPLSRRLAAISNTLPLSLAPIAIICTTSMRLPRIR